MQLRLVLSKGVDKLNLQEDPDLVLKVNTLLADSNPAVLVYAAKLGDEHVIKEYLQNSPNEVNASTSVHDSSKLNEGRA